MDNFNNSYDNNNSFNDAIFNETPQFFENFQDAEKSKSNPHTDIYEQPYKPEKTQVKQKQSGKLPISFVCIVLSLVIGAVSGFVSANYFFEKKT